jgi:U3 small nucleolar RNA-associated protein 4
MDVHRSRFVNYPTSGINALAFSHSYATDFVHDRLVNLRLAVGRANGNIEIWNPLRGNWVQEAIFHGGKNRSIEGLAWTQEPDENVNGDLHIGRSRLFSIGYSSSVTEWNLGSGIPLRTWTGNNSEIWCIATQPQKPEGKDESASQKLVIGCADGSIVVLSTEDNDLQYERYLARSTSRRARVLSLTFQDYNTVVAGFADGTVRLYDLQQGTLKRTITLGAGPKGGPKDILVWAVKCLPNGNIVSGDSLGEVRIFEKKHYSQIQRIASHDADILDLAIHKAKSAIYSAGMDRKTSHYARKTKDEQWAKTGHFSYHEHDVKAMASFEGGKMNIIASGGTYIRLLS